MAVRRADLEAARIRLVDPSGAGASGRAVEVRAPTAWRAVGHGYRVETAIVVSRAASAVRVPVGSLFRNEGRWAVFRIERGRAHLAPVTVGRNDGQLAEVLSGLRAGDRVVVHPGQAVSDGARVRARAS